MDILKEAKITLSWNNDGSFRAVIINGIITELNFCEPGRDGNTAPCQCLNSTNWKFLNDTYNALGELFGAVKEQQKELGYSFPTDGKEGEK